MRPKALLAIRSDIAADVETEYLDWLTKEHTIERVGIAGFVSARIFRCERADVRRFLILYELENAAVVDSPAYLERLNGPTAWSARMMPHLGNFVRGGGQVVRNFGDGCGAVLLPFMIESKGFECDLEKLEALSKASLNVAVRLLQVDSGRTSVPTSERSMRAGDRSFDRLLMLEALSADAALDAVRDIYPALLSAAGDDGAVPSAYSLVFCLVRADSQVV